MREKQKKIMQWSSLALILLTGIIVWRVNYEIDFMMDDEWYSTLLYADTPIRNLGDIVHAQIWHYFNWGGRSMAHALLQMILLTGESWADILNTAMTFILAWLICQAAGRVRMPYYFAALGMLFGLNANWKMSMFWEAGAANYLYMTGFILSIILTVIPFAMVMSGSASHAVILGTILVTAVVQIVVHLVYFLHMNSKSDEGWNLTAFIFTVIIIAIVVVGSIWIMWNLNYNMMMH